LHFLYLCRRSATEDILFLSRLCIHLSIHVYVHDHMLKVCEHTVLQTTDENFTKFTTCLSAVGDKDVLIRFRGQDVKGQGHSETNIGKKNIG